MTSFPFDKDHDVNDYIPDEGGQPVRAMVIPKDKYMYLTCFYEIFTLTLFWQKFCESNALTKEVTKMVVDFTKNNLVREIISTRNFLVFHTTQCGNYGIFSHAFSAKNSWN